MKPSFRLVALSVLALPALAYAAVDIPKDLLQQRDPFKMPPIVQAKGPESELEMYAAADFKLMGVLSGGNQLRAMISSPNGKTYFVKKGMTIGTRKGTISKITETALVVREKVTNALGDEENQDTVLKLPAETKTDVKIITSEQGW